MGLPLPLVFESAVGVEICHTGVMLVPVGAVVFGLGLDFVGLLLLFLEGL